MRRSPILTLVIILLAIPASATMVPQKTQSFWTRVLNFFGVSATPGRQRGPGDQLKDGKVMIYDIETATARDLTSQSGFRSPIFSADDASILVIKGEKIVRLPIAGGGAPEELFEVKGILKLVEVNMNNSSEVLVLTDADHDDCPSVGVLSLADGTLAQESYTTEDDKRLVNHLQSWKREYDNGETKFDIELTSRRDLDWTNVLFKQKSRDWINVTRCDVPGISCGHPSVSKNRKMIVFIKATSAAG